MGQAERSVTVSHRLRPVTKNEKGNQVGIGVFTHKVDLGNNLSSDRPDDKRERSGTYFIHRPDSLFYITIIKRLKGMATAKMIYFFLDFLGVPIFMYTAIINFGDFKGYFLFFVAGLYGLARLYFFIDKQLDESRMRKLQLKKKEHDVNEILNEDEV